MKYELWGVTGEECFEFYTIMSGGRIRPYNLDLNLNECDLIYELYGYGNQYYPPMLSRRILKNKRDILIESFESNHALSTSLKYEYNNEIYDIEDAIYKDDVVQIYTNIEFDILKLKDEEEEKIKEELKIYNQRVENKHEEILKEKEAEELKENQKTLKYWMERLFKNK